MNIFLLSKCLLRIKLLGALPKQRDPVLLEQHLAPAVPYRLWPLNGPRELWVRSMRGAANLWMESVSCGKEGQGVNKALFLCLFIDA